MDQLLIWRSLPQRQHQRFDNDLQGARAALGKAADKALATLVKDMRSVRETPDQLLRKSIANVSFEQLTLLKKVIQCDFPQVLAMRNPGFGDGIAKRELSLNGSPTDFTEELALKDYGSFRLEVLS